MIQPNAKEMENMTESSAFGFASIWSAGFGVLAVGLLVILLVFVVTTIFQWLWNITMPEVFRLPFITFWQAFRLILICGILFGGSPYRYNYTQSVTESKTATPPVQNIYIGQPPYELKK